MDKSEILSITNLHPECREDSLKKGNVQYYYKPNGADPPNCAENVNKRLKEYGYCAGCRTKLICAGQIQRHDWREVPISEFKVKNILYSGEEFRK